MDNKKLPRVRTLSVTLANLLDKLEFGKASIMAFIMAFLLVFLSTVISYLKVH